MRGVSIIGIGSTPFTLLKGNSLKEIGTMACKAAMDDAGITARDIEAFYLGNYVSGMLIGQETIAPLLANSLGCKKSIPCTKVEGACCSSSIAVRQGFLTVASGVYDMVLVAGVEKMSSESTEKITEALASGMDAEVEGPSGLTFPGYFGLIANRYMNAFGMTEEQMALVSVKNHNNSVPNPRARFRNQVTLEQVMNSAPVANPIKLYDSCPISDGAAALVLCASDLAKEFTDKPVEIVGSAQTLGCNSICDLEDITNLPATAIAAKQAYEMAGIGPDDVDVVELHDCFTIAEIVDSEDLGFFERGTGFKALEEEQTKIGGKVAISPSGGLLSKGHPVGATGCGQMFEVVKQLRGEHENQVKGAEIGLTHNVGAGAVCTVHILRRS